MTVAKLDPIWTLLEECWTERPGWISGANVAIFEKSMHAEGLIANTSLWFPEHLGSTVPVDPQEGNLLAGGETEFVVQKRFITLSLILLAYVTCHDHEHGWAFTPGGNPRNPSVRVQLSILWKIIRAWPYSRD